jgi:hypothetical protein
MKDGGQVTVFVRTRDGPDRLADAYRLLAGYGPAAAGDCLADGVVQSRVTAGAELTLPGRVTAPCRFQVGWAYGSVCWRSSEAARG